jgi:hypothetical protein
VATSRILIAEETIHEVDFCGVIATAANHYFESYRDSMPFLDARLEGKNRARIKIQELEDRAKGDRDRFTASDLAADAGDAIEFDDLMPLAKRRT